MTHYKEALSHDVRYLRCGEGAAEAAETKSDKREGLYGGTAKKNRNFPASSNSNQQQQQRHQTGIS
jgi:hypothetical protein